MVLLSELVKTRNHIEARIAEIIGREGDKGNFGEFIAARIFNIELAKSGRQKGYDGCFRDGPLAGSKVEIKFYPKQQRSLDINPDAWPDYFLVLVGPRKFGSAARPWRIESIFLFETRTLKRKLAQREVKIGRATSVVTALWDSAEIFPRENKEILPISKEQRNAIDLFSNL